MLKTLTGGGHPVILLSLLLPVATEEWSTCRRRRHRTRAGAMPPCFTLVDKEVRAIEPLPLTLFPLVFFRESRIESLSRSLCVPSVVPPPPPSISPQLELPGTSRRRLQLPHFLLSLLVPGIEPGPLQSSPASSTAPHPTDAAELPPAAAGHPQPLRALFASMVSYPPFWPSPCALSPSLSAVSRPRSPPASSHARPTRSLCPGLGIGLNRPAGRLFPMEARPKARTGPTTRPAASGLGPA